MTAEQHQHLTAYLANQRWFGGKGREFSVVHVHALPWVLRGKVHARVEFVTVAYDNGDTDTYQVPLAYCSEPVPSLVHALVGEVADPELGNVVVYDAAHLKSFTAAMLNRFRRAGDLAQRKGEEQTSLTFVVVEGAVLPEESDSGAVSVGEQSNTSVVYGQTAILKLFRRINAGRNPDIEIHQALTEHGSDHVAALLGWVEAEWLDAADDVQCGQLAMLQTLLRTATDGWHLALTSMRDLLIEADLHPDEVGGDFAAEAERLGAATADIHLDLAAVFDTATLTVDGQRNLARAMAQRLEAAGEAVPEIAAYVDSLRSRFDALAELDQPLRVQRIHGDLHLGQALRTVKGWKVIDFEGEPAKPLADRVELDSPLRDVAGMLRSFDYAAAATLHQFGKSDQLHYRADEWAERNRTAFLDGYASVAGDHGTSHDLVLRAYEADKAVYEAVYEARNRPTWLAIPLAAIASLAAKKD